MTPEPEWVDLGLPSGTLWAKSNLGATVPTSPGVYFSWGNIDGYPNGSGHVFNESVYAETPGYELTTDIPTDHDAAYAMLGGSWRIPTLGQIQELISNCDSVWTTINGMSGRLYTSRINGATIFFPAAGIYNGDSVGGINTSGRYWTTRIGEGTNAERFGIGESDPGSVQYNSRWYGFTIRPVRSA